MLSPILTQQLPSSKHPLFDQLLQAVTNTELNKEPIYYMHTQIKNRFKFLSDVLVHLTTKYKQTLSSAHFLASRFDVEESIEKLLSFHDFSDYELKSTPDFLRERSLYENVRHELDSLYQFSKDTSVYDPEQQWFAERFDSLQQELDTVLLASSHLDYCNAIDQTPFPELSACSDTADFESLFREYLRKFPQNQRREYYNFPKMRAKKDTASEMLVRMTRASRRQYYIQRIQNAMRQAHHAGWFMCFDTITLDGACLRDFYGLDEKGDPKRDKNGKEIKTYPIRDYTRKCMRLVLKGAGVSEKDVQTSDYYQYFAVPEYGSTTGRLHWHIIHLMRAIPYGQFDPNIRKRPDEPRNNRFLLTFHKLWSFGKMQKAIAVRYSGDAYTRAGWLATLNEKGQSTDNYNYQAIGFYVSKYINKHDEQTDLRSKALNNEGERLWKQTLANTLSKIPKRSFKVSMTRGLGLTLPTMKNLSLSSLLQLTRLDYTATPYNKIVRLNARKEMRSRLVNNSLDEILRHLPAQTNLLKSLRDLIRMTDPSKPLNFTSLMPKTLGITAISDESRRFLQQASITPEALRQRRRQGYVSK